ncbi:MAG: alkaline phosphatase family protein [Actinomycetota bacterium]
MTAVSQSKLFIFGWDAADWAVVEAGWRQGRIENLHALAERGQSGTAMSTVPPITPPAFTSFLTGTDPGEHGIFGFVTKGDGYDYRPVPGGARKVPTLVRRLDRAGNRTASVMFPYTFPAEPLEHGIVVPGWDDPEETFGSVHPPDAGRALADLVPRVPRRTNVRAPEPAFRSAMHEALELKARIARWAIDRANPRVFAMVFSETDHASHRWWLEGDPPPELIDVYDLIDRTMGGLIREFVREDDTVLVVSDHGSWPIRRFVHVAPLLAEGGFLARGRRTSGAPAGPVDSAVPVNPAPANTGGPGRLHPARGRRNFFARFDWARTKAFPLGDTLMATGVYVNCPPFPVPAVTPDEYEDVRSDVARFLSGVRDPATGDRVFSTVARREDLYRGGAVSLAPDLVVDGTTGYSPQLGRILDFGTLFTEVKRGGHRREGIFVANADLGLDAVEPIEGLLPKVLRALSFEVAPTADVEGQPSEGYNAGELEEIERRLRDLGYVE